jgi:AcrR family transcriptional regulator
MSSCPRVNDAVTSKEYPPSMQQRSTAKTARAWRHTAAASEETSAPTSKSSSNGRRSQRGDILDAAVDLFAKGGSRGTPMAAIAERIGVSIPAITHHFGSKHGLFLEVVAVSDRLDESRTMPTDVGSGLERVSAIRSWGRELAADPGLANLSRLTTTEALDADFPAHEHFVARHQRFRHMTAASISSGQRDGSIRKDIDPDRLAVEIIGFVQGTVLQWHLDPKSVDLVAVFDDYFDRLVKDLAQGSEAAAGTKRRIPKKAGKTGK